MMLLYFIFIHLSLLIPGWTLVKNSKLLKDHPGLELCAAYFATITFTASLGLLGYVLKLSPLLLAVVHWNVLLFSLYFFCKQRLYKDLAVHRFPLLILLLMTLFSLAFASLSFDGPRRIVPDPEPIAGNNYKAYNVTVLNVAQTNANDNSVPYRQAQFMVNHMDPGKDDFIDEWGVHFFQRTPLMGAVTAEYFTMQGDHPPRDYLWRPAGVDPEGTYVKFQVIAQILNALLVVPAFYLLTRFFGRRAAQVALLFAVPSQFFLYNAYFSWPKSLAGFFILFSWLLLFEKGRRYIILAGLAGATAYLTHDLAVLYFVASALLLLRYKRIRDLLIFAAVHALFALPWLITSALVYKKPSTFPYYPLSIHGIPQYSQRRAVISEFFHTSPLRLLIIRLENFIYLMTPFQLFTSEGGQTMGRRLWAESLFNVPGAMGLGLLLPAIGGAIKKIRLLDFWILAVTPVAACALFIGWPKGLGALHFAEASVMLFVGLGAWFLLTLKRTIWLLLAYAVSIAQTVFFILYSYNVRIGIWFSHFGDTLAVCMLVIIIVFCGWWAYFIANQPEPKAKAAKKAA